MFRVLRKRRFRLTPTQKAKQRQRLREVDDVVEKLALSGVKCKALDQCLIQPTEAEMTPEQKYWVHSKRYRNQIKPAHWVPHWTKVPFPRPALDTPRHVPTWGKKI
ncbi:hypothetical protein HK101_001052 [Irineochytrium annulatum]|nr:hypothetical protein HK101_001052 [Irineochytrium annulatum]